MPRDHGVLGLGIGSDAAAGSDRSPIVPAADAAVHGFVMSGDVAFVPDAVVRR
jgi:hypothetical protein